MTSPLDNEIRVGNVQSAEAFPETRKPEMMKLEVDVGDETVQSAAQLGFHHDPDDLPGTQVLCVLGLGTVNIAGFESEALTLGVPGDDGNPVLVRPESEVPLGGELY